MEWVEVRGKSADVAIEAAMQELGAETRDAVDVEVIQEPEKGFLGFGGQDAIVKVKMRPQDGNRKRRRRRRNERPEGANNQDQSTSRSRSGGNGRGKSSDASSTRPSKDRQGSSRGGGNNSGSGGSESDERSNNRKNSGRGGARSQGDGRSQQSRPPREEKPEVDIAEQAPVVEAFLTGLVDAFGLDGDVAVRIDDEVIVADVSGPQTEAMVGVRGSTIEAIHELSKTVLQRQTQSSARLRLDIAGYGERRRQALAIYANQLIDRLLEDGGEVTLEPMSAGDRKVIHDAAGERTGVRSYSEGESPQRYVVLANDASDEEE